MKKICRIISDFDMKIINNKYTLLYNRPTIHSIQQYNYLCKLRAYVFKICIGFMLSNCVNEKKLYMFPYVFQKLYWFRAIKLFKCQKTKFPMQNTQYNLELSVHKQPSVFNTIYTIQCRVNCPNVT